MNKTYLIFKHEFQGMIRRQGFIIMTLIVPLVFLLGIGIYQIISGVTHPTAEITKIGYVDNIGGFDQYTTQGNISLVRFNKTDEANTSLNGGDIKEYIIIEPSYYTTGMINLYTLEKQLIPPPEITTAIKNFLTSNLLANKVPQPTIDVIEASLNVISIRLTETGAIAPEQGGYGNLLIPSIFSLLLVLSITFSSAYLLQGLGDEKENRLIEVLLSSVSTRQLITGKVLGLGAAGLVQVLVWVITAPFLINFASSSIGGFLSTLQLPPNFLILCVVYFILGYLLFAIISTGIGAISSSAREGQQLATIFTLGAVCPLWLSSAIIYFPNSPVFVFLTIFPITAPVTLMIRLGATDVAAWQIAASIGVMLISIIGGLLLTIKIVRTFLLMYGKRPGLGAILRSLKSG
ncbi:MAG: ABC transporter permease [Dehalococcoidales bacterium]